MFLYNFEIVVEFLFLFYMYFIEIGKMYICIPNGKRIYDAKGATMHE